MRSLREAEVGVVQTRDSVGGGCSQGRAPHRGDHWPEGSGGLAAPRAELAAEVGRCEEAEGEGAGAGSRSSDEGFLSATRNTFGYVLLRPICQHNVSTFPRRVLRST